MLTLRFSSAETFDRALTALDAISKHLAIWPPMAEQAWLAEKIGLMRVLEAAVPYDERPQSLERPLWHTVKSSKRVYKRSHSSCGQHVLLPTSKRREPSLHARNPLVTWHVQEYNPLLHSLGELRVVVTSGDQVASVQRTIPLGGGWANSTVICIATLDELNAR